MKRVLFALMALLHGAASQAADVGVSVQIGQPGFYGRIDIGNAPPPVVLAEPVWVQRRPAHVEPVYMRIPPGHQKNWAKHCYRYNACGQPVYFVQEEWVRERYEERRHHDDHGRDNPGRGHGRGHGNRD